MNIYSLLKEVIYVPNKDGTGPEGLGPRTGRQMGNCNGTKANTVGSRPRGQGRRRFFRRGFGRRSNNDS